MNGDIYTQYERDSTQKELEQPVTLTKEPRYYQQVVINRTIKVVAKDQNVFYSP